MKPLGLLLTVTLLNGCVAAAPLVAGAGMLVSGWSIFKSVQLSTGGSAEIRFAKDKVGADVKKRLAVVRKIGVWPSMPEAALLADKLQKSTAFAVITPHQIQKTLGATGDDLSGANMTQAEQVAALKEVADKTGAEVFVIAAPSGFSSDMNMFSLDRPESVSHYTIRIYSKADNRYIWEDELQLVVKTGSKIPPTAEMQQIAVEAVAERLLLIAGHTESLPKG